MRTKPLSRLRIGGNFLNLIKNIYKTLTSGTILNVENLDVQPLRSGTSQICSLAALLLTLY